MSYHIYTTEGIILKRTPFGEANLLLHVLTLDLGLIIASARSARLSVSKLRPALQEYSHVSISCIKGKNGWKVTNVVYKDSFYFESRDFSHEVLVKISNLLLKMIVGESPHPEIFYTVREAFYFLKELLSENISNFEKLLVLRVLSLLGYVAEDLELKVFLEDKNKWDESLLNKVSDKGVYLVSVINKALKESQL